jgi:hypothetical protein
LESFLSLGQSIFLLATANLKSVIGRNADAFYALFTIHSAELLFQPRAVYVGDEKMIVHVCFI